MADTPSSPEVPADVAQLVSALNVMRDNLVTVSLLLQDFRFEVDEAQRLEVATAVNRLLSDARNLSGKS